MNNFDRPEVDTQKLKQFADIPEIKDPPALFCGKDCRLAYREDRIGGIALPHTYIDGKDVSYRTYCNQKNICAYCKTALESRNTDNERAEALANGSYDKWLEKKYKSPRKFSLYDTVKIRPSCSDVQLRIMRTSTIIGIPPITQSDI